MAVVMDEGTVYAFADDTEVTEGRTLLADGAVIEAESEPRGIGGLARDGSGAARGVWVQVVGRELAAECDGPCALASGRLCRHAVALALHAVERRLPWHAAPVDDTPCAPGEALDALTAVEKAAALDRLLDARPELRAEADQLAVRLLAPRARAELTALQEGTAAEVEQALRTLDVPVRARSRGGSPGMRWSWQARQRPELNPGVRPQPAHDAQLLRCAPCDEGRRPKPSRAVVRARGVRRSRSRPGGGSRQGRVARTAALSHLSPS